MPENFYTVEGSNAWGVSTFLNYYQKWTFKKTEAVLFDTLEEAQTAQKAFGLGHVECYRSEYLPIFQPPLPDKL